jgi:hypothetical protein
VRNFNREILDLRSRWYKRLSNTDFPLAGAPRTSPQYILAGVTIPSDLDLSLIRLADMTKALPSDTAALTWSPTERSFQAAFLGINKWIEPDREQTTRTERTKPSLPQSLLLLTSVVGV